MGVTRPGLAPDVPEQIGSFFSDLNVESGAQGLDFTVAELAIHEEEVL